MLLLAIGFIWVLDKLQQSAKDQGVGSVDTTRYRIHTGPLYFGDAWRNRLERVLRRAETVDLADQPAIDSITSELLALSFVEEVGLPEVHWPDGLIVPVKLREPAACIRVGDDFLPVADDGMVLAGYSYAPHEIYGAWLPILGPTEQLVRGGPPAPGDQITDPALLRALTVAGSMQRNLLPDQQRMLGRIVIDASSETAPDGLPGGVRIDLEGKRRILFGRVPGNDEPGELPAAHKWRSVLSALQPDPEPGSSAEGAPRENETPWDLLDVRFDTPVIHYRQAAGDGS